MKIRILDNHNHESRLTISKIYEVIEYGHTGDQDDFIVINDKGEQQHIWEKLCEVKENE